MEISKEVRSVFNTTLGEEVTNRLFGKELSEIIKLSIGLMYRDMDVQNREFAHLDFENYQNEELYTLFETKVILKRMRVLYPEMSITTPALVLLMMHSESVGNLVDNLTMFVEDAKSEGSKTVTAINSKCWSEWPRTEDM